MSSSEIEEPKTTQIAKFRRQTIDGIQVPPTLEECYSYGDMPYSFVKMVNAKKFGFSSKGLYLHWHDFHHRFDSDFKDKKVWAWCALKFNRALDEHGSLVSEDNSHFYWSPIALNHYPPMIEKAYRFEHVGLTGDQKRHMLVKSLVMEEAITSAQLEGAATTRAVAKEMLSSGRAPNDDSENMILSNWNLMQFALDNLDRELSIEFIQEFNHIATEKTCENDHIPGMLRSKEIEVAKNNAEGEVTHKAPDAKVVDKLLNDLCKYANTNHENVHYIHPVFKAIVIHFMIGYIHPFLDGNGRTARALFYWYAIKHGYENFQYISISALLKKKANDYGRAYIKTETDELDLTYFLQFNLEIIIDALGDFSAYIQKRIDQNRYMVEKLSESPFYKHFKRQHIDIISKALKNPGREFSVKEVEQDNNVSATAARGYLDKLYNLGLLLKYKSVGNKFTYFAPAKLQEQLFAKTK
ncbi:Fic family protein [Pseudoalteromonas sp. NZS37]|uniref:Fic family protein n=1 Tax=Pseudoalteromonas sp. NZS37 TaxID=2792071 RepID=UPI0018CD7856|nr:Fic family protein [Pseudoalteromonas sp. NZS37]MBG9992010.1 Fic family protein [Pseudoalteromonas sp. NZS37]